MIVHIFRSGREPDVFGFTVDETGANLPGDLGPWTASVTERTWSLGGGSADTPGAASTEAATAAIEQTGFYVARSATISRDSGVPWMD